MLVKTLCQKYLKKTLSFVHAKRLNALFDCCWSLMNKADLTLTSIGRNMENKAYVKHNIKKVDRLLKNPLLQDEMVSIYKEISVKAFSCLDVPYILVDWSGCCSNEYHLLRASLVYEGRSIVLYQEIYETSQLGSDKAHKIFLKNLSTILPANRKIVVITDAGFKTPWFKGVLSFGWDYIGRIRDQMKVRLLENEDWFEARSLFPQATHRIKYHGTVTLGKCSRTPVEGSLYLY